jgi:ferredoxin-NADP reductase
MVIGRTPAAWHAATVASVTQETPTARRIAFDIPTWPGNDAGAHLDVRLTADDGYQATRSYSIASSGPGTRVVLAVAEVRDGEVSPYLVHDLRPGDKVEVHGPLGAYFVWKPPVTDADDPQPVQLIAGGSGVVPLFAMAEAHARTGDPTAFRMLYSVRTPADVFFSNELTDFAMAQPPSGLALDLVYTRVAAHGSPRPPGRLTSDLVAELTWPASATPRVFVCGPTPFVETVAHWLVGSGHAPAAIRTERFGGA